MGLWAWSGLLPGSGVHTTTRGVWLVVATSGAHVRNFVVVVLGHVAMPKPPALLPLCNGNVGVTNFGDGGATQR